MDGRRLRILAIITALGAVLFGYLAFQISRERALQQAVAVRPGESTATWPKAVVAIKPIARGKPIEAEALELVPVRVRPDGGFNALNEVVGRVPTTAIGVGEPLAAHHFVGGSALAQQLAPGERAVAVMVNDVIGVGGYVQPGDYVDVLVYLSADGRQVRSSQARLVLERLRVLAYGDAIEERTARARGGNHTAVLAVPAAEVPNLTLAASAGALRLALHGAAPREEKTDGKVRPATLAELARLGGARGATGETTVIYRGGAKSVTTR